MAVEIGVAPEDLPLTDCLHWQSGRQPHFVGQTLRLQWRVGRELTVEVRDLEQGVLPGVHQRPCGQCLRHGLPATQDAETAQEGIPARQGAPCAHLNVLIGVQGGVGGQLEPRQQEPLPLGAEQPIQIIPPAPALPVCGLLHISQERGRTDLPGLIGVVPEQVIGFCVKHMYLKPPYSM